MFLGFFKILGVHGGDHGGKKGLAAGVAIGLATEGALGDHRGGHRAGHGGPFSRFAHDSLTATGVTTGVLFGEAWKAPNPRRVLFKEALKAPTPWRVLFREANGPFRPNLTHRLDTLR